MAIVIEIVTNAIKGLQASDLLAIFIEITCAARIRLQLVKVDGFFFCLVNTLGIKIKGYTTIGKGLVSCCNGNVCGHFLTIWYCEGHWCRVEMVEVSVKNVPFVKS